MSRPARLFVCAGDASGDQHAAELVRELLARRPEVRVDALGGPALARTPVHLLHRLADDPVMGFVRVAGALRGFMRLLSAADRWLARERPDAVLLVDYPGFNVHLAALARRRGIPVIYYVCPQYWAWAPWRVHRFARVVDEALAIFPFEVDYFGRHGLKVHHVGHPAADRIALQPPPPPASGPWTIALLAGSRSAEVRQHWPWMLDVGRRLRDSLGVELRFVTTHLQEAHRQRLAREAREAGLPVEVRDQELPALLTEARAALVGSGTATLECALSGVPSCVLYRVDRVSLLLSRFLMNSPYISQPNLLAGDELFPEFLRCQDPGVELASRMESLIVEGEPRSRCLLGLERLRRAHLRPGTAARAADRVLRHLG